MGNKKPAKIRERTEKNWKGNEKAKDKAKNVDIPKMQMRLGKYKGSGNIETEM